jgi:hypothetical protein
MTRRPALFVLERNMTGDGRTNLGFVLNPRVHPPTEVSSSAKRRGGGGQKKLE